MSSGKNRRLYIKTYFGLKNCELECCPFCNSDSTWSATLDNFTPCVKCGGIGFIMKVKPIPAKKRQKLMRSIRTIPASYEA